MPDGQFRVGQKLDNYYLIRHLGDGSFGDVYLAEHLYHKNQVALKLLPRLSDHDMPTFLNEARTIRLKHPSIVQVQDFGIANYIPFIAMDYAPNGTLRQRHPRGTRVPLPQILSYVKQTASALQYAHDERVIHRDIKPENLLLGANGQLLVSDFGIATMAHGSFSQSNTQELAGTASYMAPEQSQGKPRFASDQYSLAVIIYEWLCGERPFEGAPFDVVAQHITAPPPPLHTKMPIFPAIERVIMTALAKDPKDRYPTIHAFASALETAYIQMQQFNAPISAYPLTPLRPSPTPPSSAISPITDDSDSQIPTSHLLYTTATSPSFDHSAQTYAQTLPPQSQLSQPTRPHRRTYIAIMLGIFLTIMLSISGVYLLNKGENVDQVLNDVNLDITGANASLLKNDPTTALADLSQAQHALPKEILTGNEVQRVESLRTALATLFTRTYALYNQQNNITTLACTNTKSIQTTEAAFPANLKSLAVVENGTKEFFYTLGDDHSLYLFDNQQQHLTKITFATDNYVEMIAGDNTSLIVLTSQQDGQNPRLYKLYVYQPDEQGNLSVSNETDISMLLISQGNIPQALTAWGDDVFVALASKATSSNITLLYYSLTNNQFGTQGPMQSTSTISSNASSIISMVAFQNKQLFVLDDAGGLKSIQFVKDTTPPSDVILQGKMPAPLNVTATTYNASTPVPVPSIANNSTFLQLSGATGMAVGTLSDDTYPHLFILDGNANRVLELKVVQATPVVTSTPVGGGSGAMAPGLSMQLVNQFASVGYLANAKSIVVDPTSTQNMLYALTQDSQHTTIHSFISIGTRQNNNNCPH